MLRAFCRLSSPRHFRESNRGLRHRQRNCGGRMGSADFALPLGPGITSLQQNPLAWLAALREPQRPEAVLEREAF